MGSSGHTYCLGVHKTPGCAKGGMLPASTRRWSYTTTWCKRRSEARDYFPCAVWGTSASRAMFNSPRASGHSGQGGGGIQPGWSWALCCGYDAKGTRAPAAVMEPTPCIKTRGRHSGRDWVPLPTLQTLQLARHPPVEPPGTSWALSACLPFPPLLSASSFIIPLLLPPSLCLSSLPLPFVPSLLFPSLLAGASPHLQSLLQLPSLCQLSIDPLFSIGGQLS